MRSIGDSLHEGPSAVELVEALGEVRNRVGLRMHCQVMCEHYPGPSNVFKEREHRESYSTILDILEMRWMIRVDEEGRAGRSPWID